jgi:solute carrier family 25 (mitochondrial citrate transporter), member 1
VGAYYSAQVQLHHSKRPFSHIGANFTAYQELKKLAQKWQPDTVELPSYQHMMIGLISGAVGPFTNAPIDTIKTRMSSSLYSCSTWQNL